MGGGVVAVLVRHFLTFKIRRVTKPMFWIAILNIRSKLTKVLLCGEYFSV
jgi:hypothetical protein